MLQSWSYMITTKCPTPFLTSLNSKQKTLSSFTIIYLHRFPGSIAYWYYSAYVRKIFRIEYCMMGQWPHHVMWYTWQNVMQILMHRLTADQRSPDNVSAGDSLSAPQSETFETSLKKHFFSQCYNISILYR